MVSVGLGWFIRGGEIWVGFWGWVEGGGSREGILGGGLVGGEDLSREGGRERLDR